MTKSAELIAHIMVLESVYVWQIEGFQIVFCSLSFGR